MRPAFLLRTRTMLQRGSLGIAVVLATACGSGPVPGASSTASPSPSPAGTHSSQPVTATGTPSARWCSGKDLSARVAPGHPGDTQDVGVLVVIRNKSATRCLMTGTPRAAAEMSTAVTSAVPPDPVTSSLPPGWGRALLAHGSIALLRFRAPEECARGANQTPPCLPAADHHDRQAEHQPQRPVHPRPLRPLRVTHLHCVTASPAPAGTPSARRGR